MGVLAEDRFGSYRRATASALLDGPGTTSVELRRAVAAGTAPDDLLTLVRKIRTAAHTVTDRDVEALKGRYTEDQLFEIIVAAAFGMASGQLAAAHRALEDA
jgi:hypothetical protein